MTTDSHVDVPVPLVDLAAEYAPLRSEILAALTRVADSQRFILGPEVDGLEHELAEVLETGHAIGVSSGTDALLVALMALGIGAGAEVIVPTYSFFATAGSVSRLGATPVFVDIDPVTFNIDPDGVRRALTSRTRAIIPVHLFGLAADMDAISAIARDAGVPIVEDAAQSIGARYHGRVTGTIGAVGCFSFFPTKNLAALGDGGVVITDDAALARELRLLRGHGAESKYVHTRIGGNFRLDALQAAVLRVKLPHLPSWSEQRRRNADRYRRLMRESGVDRVLTLPVESAGCTHIYNQFVIRGARRDDLRAFLSEHRIGSEVYYPVPFHRQPCYRDLPGRGAFPVADRAAETSLALPIFGALTEAQQRHVVDTIARFYGRVA